MRYTISQAEVLLRKAIALPLHKNNVAACKKVQEPERNKIL